MMGKLNCVSSLNVKALAWEKEEDMTQVGQVTEREVFPNKDATLPPTFRTHHEIYQGLKPSFFLKGKSGLRNKSVMEASPSPLEQVRLGMNRRGGGGWGRWVEGGRAGTQVPSVCR